MKRNIIITTLFLLVSFVFSACAPASQNDQIPGFLNDIGKPLSELKSEYPNGEFLVNLDGFPDFEASCFGEAETDYAYFFFGGHDGDFEKAMNECEEQLKCAGFVTTANMLFPAMEDDMSFQDFFSMIGVTDYEYFGEEVPPAEGWLRFMYRDMEVMINTNEAVPGGGWNITGEEIVKMDAPASIVDLETLYANNELAQEVMF